MDSGVFAQCFLHSDFCTVFLHSVFAQCVYKPGITCTYALDLCNNDALKFVIDCPVSPF